MAAAGAAAAAAAAAVAADAAVGRAVPLPQRMTLAKALETGVMSLPLGKAREQYPRFCEYLERCPIAELRRIASAWDGPGRRDVGEVVWLQGKLTYLYLRKKVLGGPGQLEHLVAQQEAAERRGAGRPRHEDDAPRPDTAGQQAARQELESQYRQVRRDLLHPERALSTMSKEETRQATDQLFRGLTEFGLYEEDLDGFFDAHLSVLGRSLIETKMDATAAAVRGALEQEHLLYAVPALHPYDPVPRPRPAHSLAVVDPFAGAGNLWFSLLGMRPTGGEPGAWTGVAIEREHAVAEVLHNNMRQLARSPQAACRARVSIQEEDVHWADDTAAPLSAQLRPGQIAVVRGDGMRPSTELVRAIPQDGAILLVVDPPWDGGWRQGRLDWDALQFPVYEVARLWARLLSAACAAERFYVVVPGPARLHHRSLDALWGAETEHGEPLQGWCQRVPLLEGCGLPDWTRCGVWDYSPGFTAGRVRQWAGWAHRVHCGGVVGPGWDQVLNEGFLAPREDAG